jgi:hypothetical protein
VVRVAIVDQIFGRRRLRVHLLPSVNGSRIMPRYYLHLRDGTDQILDPERLDLDGMEAVRKAVLRGARDTISHEVSADGIVDLRFRIDAEDEEGEVVYSLPFKHAISVIPEPA